MHTYKNALIDQCTQMQRDLEHSEVIKAIIDENSVELSKAEREQDVIERQLS